MDKKKEKDILKMVYEDNYVEDIIDGENPDFRVRNKNQQYYYGVEVTELYYSESNARLKNIPSYFTEIMDKKRYRHKKDKEILKIQEFTLIPNDKPNEQVEGIFQELPPISEYVQMVVEVINNKNERIEDYIKKDITHVNLIILDTENRLIQLSNADFHHYFFSQQLKTSLCNSDFREIFLITKFEINKWVYIPLKMLFLMSELYLFDSFVKRSYLKMNFKSQSEELTLFAQYLLYIRAKGIYIVNSPDEFEVIYGNCGVIIKDNNELIARNYTDYMFPKNALPFINENTETIINKTFKMKFDKFTQNNKFTINLSTAINIVDNTI